MNRVTAVWVAFFGRCIVSREVGSLFISSRGHHSEAIHFGFVYVIEQRSTAGLLEDIEVLLISHGIVLGTKFAIER